MKAHICAWLALTLVVLCGSVPSGATKDLLQLVCLNIDASVSGPAHPEVTRESLRRTIFVELKAKLPQLLTPEDCVNDLIVAVQLMDMSTSRLNAWHGILVFEVRRPVTVNHTGEILNARVWAPGYLLFHGSKDTVSDQVTRTLTKFIERLAEEYYLSGN
jgi:hypothetical protein